MYILKEMIFRKNTRRTITSIKFASFLTAVLIIIVSILEVFKYSVGINIFNLAFLELLLINASMFGTKLKKDITGEIKTTNLIQKITYRIYNNNINNNRKYIKL